jgi:hypothetical protein
MRIPPLYEKPTWQRFFVGVVIGSILSWFVFLYLYGELQDMQLKKIVSLQSEVRNLNDKIDIWKEDYQKLNEQNKKMLTIQDIKVNFTNEKQVKIDSFTKLALKDEAMDELKFLFNKNIETVAESKSLIIRAIENKTITVDDQKYKLTVKQLYLVTTLELYLEIERVT